MHYRILPTALLLSCLTVPALAEDWIVDSSGEASPHTEIDQAMTLSSPGDRIFVLPGTYPAFHFSRGVEVHGMGQTPADVVVARVDYHIHLPSTDYDSVLTNMTLCGSAPADGISISGNELAPGTLIVSGVETCGGVFLEGDSQFYLLMNRSTVRPGPGAGFLDSAFTFGGGVLDLVHSQVHGWNAAPVADIPAGTGLRIRRGATVRVAASQVRGGNGARGQVENAFLSDGATAILSGYGLVPPTLRLAGESLVGGGAGFGTGAGGHGVDVDGNVLLGESFVLGGSGSSRGLPYASESPRSLGFDPHLEASPTPLLLTPGASMSVALDPSIGGYPILFGSAIDSPGPSLSPLAERRYLGHDRGHLECPRPLPGTARGLERRWVVLQAFFTPPQGTGLLTTTPVFALLEN